MIDIEQHPEACLSLAKDEVVKWRDWTLVVDYYTVSGARKLYFTVQGG